MRVAITGGIACGKSLFSCHLGRLGVEILDADDVAHELEAPGGEAVPVIRSLFGDGVIGVSGGVDRALLARRVFADPMALARLNRSIHPLVREAVERWLARPGKGVRAVVVPLLFEAGWEGGWDCVICLTSSEATQIRRLMLDRGLTREQALQRISAQMPVAEKAARSNFVVQNDADAEALAQEAVRVYRLLMEKRI